MILGQAVRASPAPRAESLVWTLSELLKEWQTDCADASAALQSSPVAAAHRILTNSMGSLPIGLYRKDGERREGVGGHRTLYPLTVRANPDMTPMIFKKIMQSRCFWDGESFAYIDRRASPMQLLPLPYPASRHRDDAGIRWYSFSVNGIERKFAEPELLHLYFETLDGKRGVGLLDLAKQGIQTDLAAQRYSNKFYTNGARPSGIIEVASKVEKAGKDAVRREFENMVGGMDNVFRVAVLDLGMKYTQLGMNQSDAQFVETRDFTVSEIARFTGIPLHKLQAGKQSYSSNEAQGIDYVVSTLQPIVVQWEQEFLYKLLTDAEQRGGFYYRFNLAAEMRGDNKSRSEFLAKMIQNGIYTPNEARALEECDAKPGGDELLISKNYAPLRGIVCGSP